MIENGKEDTHICISVLVIYRILALQTIERPILI